MKERGKIMTDRLDASPAVATMLAELKGLALQQMLVSNSIISELKDVTDNTAEFRNVSATLTEYRKALHDRFDTIHQRLAEADLSIEKCQNAIRIIELNMHGVTSLAKFAIAAVTALVPIMHYWTELQKFIRGLLG
jgi:hypothetical protein